jgi:hypothetical protein
MKTTITAFLSLLASFTLNAGPVEVPAIISLDEEAYVDDIPFDTRSVVADMVFELDPETGANDIPFDTRSVVMNTRIQKEEESYANDIPFDTRQVILSWVPAMTEESFVQDIPFNTQCVTYQVRNNLPAGRCFEAESSKRSHIEAAFHYGELVSAMVSGIGRSVEAMISTFLFML